MNIPNKYKSKISRWRRKILSLARSMHGLSILGVGLVGLVIYLVISSYFSQLELQQKALIELGLKTEDYAKSLGYFYSERVRDVNHLAELTEIQTYFDNLAMGMTPEYGLTASLVNVGEKFTYFVNNNHMRMNSGESRKIYKNVFFLNETSGVLAENTDSDVSTDPNMKPFFAKLQSNHGGSQLHLLWQSSDNGNILREFVATPYSYKGTYRGHIVAEIGTGLFRENFINGSGYILTFENRPINLSDCESCVDNKITSDVFATIWEKNPEDSKNVKIDAPTGKPFLAVKVNIRNSPFALVKILPEKNITGVTSPWVMVVVLLVMLVFMIIGVVINIRARAKRIQAELVSAQKDKALVAAVQSFFLPNPTHLKTATIEIGGYYRSADEAGGDWWWYGLSPDKEILTVVMGDVTGHGAASAMLTAAIAGAFKSMEKDSAIHYEPNIILEELNTMFLEYANEKFLMTISVMNFELTKMKITHWSAGAPPIYKIHRQTGALDAVGDAGTPLGSVNFKLGKEEAEIDLEDRFFCFTDGVIEFKTSEGEQIKLRALRRILSDCRNFAVKDSIQYIHDQLEIKREDMPLADDVTFAIVDMPRQIQEMNVAEVIKKQVTVG